MCSATVLYDRPPAMFRPLSFDEKHDLLSKLVLEFSDFALHEDGEKNAFTYLTASGEVALRHNRPALLISSTSWTPDEDFSILLTALETYETCSKEKPLPQLVCVITGKGPEKEYYRNLIASKNFQNVRIVLPWLSSEDYPKLLACADLGVCLHKSSSDLDLPMKVVDMFGCGLPVCAIKYSW